MFNLCKIKLSKFKLRSLEIQTLMNVKSMERVEEDIVEMFQVASFVTVLKGLN